MLLYCHLADERIGVGLFDGLFPVFSAPQEAFNVKWLGGRESASTSSQSGAVHREHLHSHKSPLS